MRWLDVLASGLLSTCQDSGRPGWAHLGVPRSGALDGPAYELANRLVGNPASAAVLESTLGGLAVRSSTPMVVALTGAMADLVVGGRVCAWGEPVPVAAGETVEISAPRWGVRSYLAVAGGIAVEPVLGSRSTDLLSGTGPAPLHAADRLPLGDPGSAPRPVDVALFLAPPDPAWLRLSWGPRHEWFVRADRERFAATTYVVTQQSNRVGVGLTGFAVGRHRDDELPSEGLVLGAVQIPPDGQPVIFLADHPTTGGYPVIGVVATADLATCAQLAPGARVRFRAPAQ